MRRYPLLRLAKQRTRRTGFRQNSVVTAWPFVAVILIQMAIGGFSVYTLATIRAFVTNDGIWTNGEHEAVYSLSRFLETKKRSDFESYERAIAVPLAYYRARAELESAHPDIATARRDLMRAGAARDDVGSLIWMFRNFRGFPFLEASIARWQETDPSIFELQRLGAEIGSADADIDSAAFRDRIQQIDKSIAPRARAFTEVLDDGGRAVERFLTIVNLAFAAALAGLTIWRVGRTIAQRRQIEAKLAWQATHDELTGLLNRRAFEERMSRLFTPANGAVVRSLALLFIDLDQFKIVNDTCGHAAGDALLRRICPPLERLLGSEDVLSRFGGDEFSILLVDVDAVKAAAVAEAVRAAVEGIDFVWKGRSFTVTASVGLVHERAGSLSSEEMLSRADMACFMAKEKGRNCVHVRRFEDEELLGRIREMNWVQRIHQALNEDRFCLYAQQIVPLDRSRKEGMRLEVLLRMRDETGTLVPPSSFLPAAERFGLMKLIDRWVVRRSFRTLADRSELVDSAPIASCGINLSGPAIGDKAFLAFLKGAFAEFGIPPRMICFEVTETSAIVNLEAAREFILDLRRLGCTFALDDFGSGMSSFTYLKELPVDFLKIDGSFVQNILTEPADRAMVEMIGHVGHVMGKRIVAEFVESDALADALREIGIDYGQGFGIALPTPFDSRYGSDAVQPAGSRTDAQRLIA